MVMKRLARMSHLRFFILTLNSLSVHSQKHCSKTQKKGSYRLGSLSQRFYRLGTFSIVMSRASEVAGPECQLGLWVPFLGWQPRQADDVIKSPVSFPGWPFCSLIIIKAFLPCPFYKSGWTSQLEKNVFLHYIVLSVK